MNKPKFLRKVMDIMEPKMSQFGFEESFSSQRFFKKFDEDFLAAYLLSIFNKFDSKKKREAVIIEPSLYIHYRPIEKIYARITTRKIGKVTDLRTIGNLLSEIIANPSGHYIKYNTSLSLLSYTEDDAEGTANRLIDYFSNFALDYFETNTQVLALDRIFNSDLDFNNVNCVIETERGIRGIILAKLLGTPDLHELITIHLERIQKIWNDNYKIEFSRLMELLKNWQKSNN